MIETRPRGRHLLFGTRGSALAKVQTDHVLQRLASSVPGLRMSTAVIRTEGDIDKVSPLSLIGGRGVFTSALQHALYSGRIDVAVHSAKDLPSERPPGLQLVAFPEREDPRDVLVSRHRVPLAALPPRPTIGTSSRRRALQVRLLRPDAQIVELRGNVDTRLRKALETDVDGIIVAAAGVQRMGWSDQITEELSLQSFVPSPGQGALAIEVRTIDAEVVSLLAPLNDPAVSLAVRAERAFLRSIGAGCTSPIGAYAVAEGGHLQFRAMLASDDGERIAWASEPLATDQPEEHATEIGLRLRSRVFVDRSRPTSRPDSSPQLTAHQNGSQRERPLAGISVLVTRARAQAGELIAALQMAGAEPVLLPTVKIEAPSNVALLDDALGDVAAGQYDWVIFTSVNAVDRTMARPGWPVVADTAWTKTRVAAVGKATTTALKAAGVRVDLVPNHANAVSLAKALIGMKIDGQRILYPKADIARPALVDTLAAAGASVTAVDAYRTVPETEIDLTVLQRLNRGGIDIVTFASPSSVRHLWAALGHQFAVLDTASIVCVGSVTAAAARELGLAVDLIAADASVNSLVETMVQARRDNHHWPAARQSKMPVNAEKRPREKELV